MEKPLVITISRQFASMGRTIAQKLSGDLGIDFYDRDIVAAAAKRLNISIPEVSRRDEEAGSDSFLMRKNYLFNFSVYNLRREIFEVEKNIIEDFAEKGPCIIVGRCAENILRKRPNTLRVFIHAPFEARLHNCVDDLMIDDVNVAEATIKKVDAAREAYRRQYGKVNDPYADRDLSIDSSAFGIDGAAALIAHLARQRL